MNSFKQKVHNHFAHLLEDKIAVVQKNLNDLKESLTGETKSTAGDKHETARAFVHIEQENTTRQLEALMQQKAELDRVTGLSVQDTIIPGALIKTDRGWFYLSTGVGKAVVDAETVFALSAQSPLGKLLLNKTVNDRVEMNGTKYLITEIN
jgi:hypothetical protein